MSVLKEFRDFAVKGNVIDLAVGVIIGAAFGKIVDSLVGDIIMPLISRLIGHFDFTNLFVKLTDGPAGIPQTYAALKVAGVPMLAFGNFLTIVMNFVILAFVIFLMVKQMNRIKKNTPVAPAPIPEDVLLLREILETLKK